MENIDDHTFIPHNLTEQIVARICKRQTTTGHISLPKADRRPAHNRTNSYRSNIILPLSWPHGKGIVAYLLGPNVRRFLDLRLLIMKNYLNGISGVANLSFLIVVLRRPAGLALVSRSRALCTIKISCVDVRYLVTRQGDRINFDNLLVYVGPSLRQTGH